MLWLSAMDAQAAPWTEAWISSQRTQNMQISINESTHSLDATVALGGPEAVRHPKDPVHGNQDKLTALMREINDFCQ